jgi:hypothetical protein
MVEVLAHELKIGYQEIFHNLSPSHNPPKRIPGLMCLFTKTWNEEALNTHFFVMDVKAIQHILISHVTKEDFLACIMERHVSSWPNDAIE